MATWIRIKELRDPQIKLLHKDGYVHELAEMLDACAAVQSSPKLRQLPAMESCSSWLYLRTACPAARFISLVFGGFPMLDCTNSTAATAARVRRGLLKW